MLGNLTNQLWAELLESLNKEDVQTKIKDTLILPVIRHLIDGMFNYIVIIVSLFSIIIILLIVVIYNQMKIIK